MFRLACRYVGQAPSKSLLAREANRALGANVGEQRIGDYLRFLGATLATIPGLDIAHLPEKVGDPEVDFVLTIGTRRIPVEVKHQSRIEAQNDTEGLRTFLEKTANNAAFGLLVTQVEADTVLDPRIVALPLSSFMLLR